VIKKKINNYFSKRNCTLLGVGPMSVNCVDSVLELTNEYNVPIILIASRRQIDSEQFNGGYVNNWTTSEFANYVRNKDKVKNVILARDHGGPWQNNNEIEKKMNPDQAMRSAKDSFKSDIDAGFEILHIDPSIDINGPVPKDKLMDRLFELYEYCWDYAKKSNKEIAFEVGTEEQSGSTNTPDNLNETLHLIEKFCNKNKILFPSFVVIQTGTKVMEMRNIGSFDSPLRVENEIAAEIQVPKMIEICKNFNIFMKEHNTDYLSDQSLLWHPRLGIHAANVAPEFGVAETVAFLQILENNNLRSLALKFIELSHNSKKWQKWMLPNSTASVREKALISGHYIFSTPECIELRKEALFNLKKKGIDLNAHLCQQIKKSIFRYMYNFRLTEIA
jgi:tagatose-1,6-bisphosphate aldolase non-catalytic subunit AgaZ/GatZ